MPVYERLDPIATMVSAPTDVAFDSSENIYVVESSKNNLLIFSQSGQYQDTLTGLNKPISVMADNNGRIYIGNKDTGNVEVYDNNLNIVHMLGSGNWEFSQPNDIAIDSFGKIYVVDYLEDKIKVYHPDGSYDHSLGSPGSGDGEFHKPTSITIDEAAGELIVLDHQLTQDMFGNWIEGARIQTFYMNGGFKRSFSKYGNNIGEMFRPQHVTVDDQSRLYVTDSFHNVVLVYDNAGTHVGDIYDVNNPLRTPLGIALSNSGKLYIASLITGKVEIFGIDTYTNMELDPLSLTFQGTAYGNNPSSQNVAISNNGTEILDWTAYTEESWIILSDTSGSIDISSVFNLSVDVNLAGLLPDTYEGSISIRAASGATEIVPVILTVLPDPPVAHPGGPYLGIEGQAIILDGSNSSGSLILYEWDINYDGVADSYEHSSSSPLQSHTYSSEGIYTIKLRVTDQGAATHDALTSATISDSFPSPDFNGSPASGTSPLSVNFTNNSTGYDQPLIHEWDFNGDGITDSTEHSPTYMYDNPGTYSVTLTVTDSDGSVNSLTRSSYINVSSLYNLNIYSNGSGSGRVKSSSPGIDCGIDCEEAYNVVTEVTLSAIPEAGSIFTGWAGGNCSGTGDCVITMNADADITATFDACQNLPVRIEGNPPAYYATLQSSYTISADGDIMQSQAARYIEDLNIDADKSVTLVGGYRCDYSSYNGKTIVNGSVVISNGTVTIENYILE
jgi:PKD repeat protein